MKPRHPVYIKISELLQEFFIPVLFLTAILGLIIFIINRDLPKVGHDYDFFIPRMLDTHLHYKVNGPGIQWYTPNFGAGLPAYPNPQHIQYSLPQILMLVINPWLALMSSLILYAAIGFISFYTFLRYEMGWISSASALGASFILANGFFVEHAIVGHVGFQSFPLFGVILFLAFTKRIGFLPAGILIGILCAMILNQAGFIILVVFGFSLLIVFPLTYLIRSDLFDSKFFATLLTGGVAAFLLSASKISAVLAFMRFFPRIIEDEYKLTYFQGIIGILKQFAGFNFLVPQQVLTGTGFRNITLFFQNATGSEYEIWETNIFLSPGLLVLLTVGFGYLIFEALRNKPSISKDKVIAVLVLCLTVWLTTEMTLAQGWLYKLLKPLPVIRSLHVNIRFAAAFIFPLAVLGAYIYQRMFKDKKVADIIMTLLMGSSTIAALSLYFFLPQSAHSRLFNLGSALQTYVQIDEGWNFSVNSLSVIKNMDVFQDASSNLDSEDPMFGYDMSFFTPKAIPGPVLEVRDSYYNMTNPASYVFPEENGLEPFELFRTDQKENLELFLSHRQPHLKTSSWQKFANVLSLTTAGMSFLYILFAMIKGSVRIWQKISSAS